MVKTVVKPIFGGSKRCQEIENPTPHKFFSAVIIPYLEEIVKRLLSTLKICIAVVKEKSVAITATLVAAPEDSNLTGGPFYVFIHLSLP